MRTSHSTLAIAALGAAFGFQFGSETLSRAADRPAAPPTPIVSANPAARSLGERSSSDAGPLSTVKQRRQADQAPQAPQPSVTPPDVATPPVPMEPDAPAAEPQVQLAPQSVPQPAPAVIAPPVPFVPPFVSPGRAAIHERLRARRLARVQQMRRNAEATGDQQGIQRAEMLEGAVNELHNQGLFNFAQKVMGAFQSGQLSLDQLKGGGQASASGSSVEMPEADLGEAAPLTSDPLPESDLGAPAPLSPDDAPSDSDPALPPPPPAN